MTNAEFKIAVLPGDGIGLEVMTAARAVLDAVAHAVGGFRLVCTDHEVGAGAYLRHGVALGDECLRGIEASDAVLLGAMGLPDVRLPDGREIAPQLDLREHFGLFAGVRPIRAIPGVPAVLAAPDAARIDLVIVRESTEGLFAERALGTIENDSRAVDRLVITRPTCERLFDFAFDLARRRRAQGRPGRVDCVDKANVLRSMAFFRAIFLERAGRHPDLPAGTRYVDATALDLVRAPWAFDVLVTENMFGDILSDLGAALIGGMGMAPSADIGDGMAVFQPSHGTAPDIMGRGIANPTAMVLSAAMMLDWLGHRHDVEPCRRAARLIERAVDGVWASGAIRTAEFGGPDGTEAVTAVVVAALRDLRP